MSQYIQFNSGAIRAGDCISEGWEWIKPQYWLFFGMAFLALVLTACIPCLNIFLVGPIMAGIFFVHFTLFRRQPIDFGMMFKGFEKFVPAMVVGLIQAIPGIITQGVQYTADLGNVARQIIEQQQRGTRSTQFLAQSSSADFALTGGFLALILVFALVALLFAIAWNITFYFAIPLVADKNVGVGEAISLSARAGWSNIGGIIILAILQALVGILGALACGIGIFFVLPIIYASSAVAYRQVFPDTQQQFNAPPRPDAYGGSYGKPV